MTAPKNAPVKATPPARVPTPAPAPVKQESEAAKASRTAPLDLSALSLTKTAPPKRDGSNNAGRKPADNSVAEGWVRDSWSARVPTGFKNKLGAETHVGAGFSLPPMTSENAALILGRLRKAAKTLGVGLSVDPNTVEKGRTDVVVTFAAKTPNVPGAGRKPNASK